MVNIYVSNKDYQTLKHGRQLYREQHKIPPEIPLGLGFIAAEGIRLIMKGGK